MPKVIEDIELLKKLTPYIWETEYVIDDMWDVVLLSSVIMEWPDRNTDWYEKTLTLEEAIELLPSMIWRYSLYLSTETVEYYNYSWDFTPALLVYFKWKTLLEAIEKMLEYLLDNDLLWNKN